ncbi:hypothetical protein [Pseudomonas syringae group genomosp. 3]|uniref:hypothetical protein n=1 Tax=Pseudomonas syringae group genomosp. 3 TaxID=251701 RepID=UPI0001E27EDE|nr:hypothetical protein [Pseudomonas syringae group genomosp. 3]
MRLKPEYAQRLVELSNRGNNSPAISLIIARRFARHLVDERAFERANFRQAIAQAKAGLPFTANKLAELEKQEKNKREQRRTNLKLIADWFRGSDEVLVALYGFNGICDLLNVNPVHRIEAESYVDRASGYVTAIAFICGLEDSASTSSGRKRSEYNDGPLFHAFHAQMMQIMIENPGAMPDPFAPGAPLHGLPTYHQQPDGSMARKSPSLVVHDAKGSRVVERKVEVNK